jgi:hypothetical protein
LAWAWALHQNGEFRRLLHQKLVVLLEGVLWTIKNHRCHPLHRRPLVLQNGEVNDDDEWTKTKLEITYLQHRYLGAHGSSLACL